MPDVLENVNTLFALAHQVLVVVSDPVDPDCIGCGLALKWLLSRQGKQVRVVSFFRIPHNMASFPDVSEVETPEIQSFSFKPFDAVALVDGSSWGQFLGKDGETYLSRLDMAKVVNLDHHVPADIQAMIPDRCLNVRTSSTVQLLYECLIAPSGVDPPPEVAGYMYLALLYDSRYFKNEMHPGEYQFAEKLIGLGADHARAADVNLDRREIDFMVWAVQHTQYFQDLGLTLLAVDSGRQAELESRFGENWKDFDALYKETFERQVRGFNYGIMLIDGLDESVRLNWRTRNYGDLLSVAEIAQRAGFEAGGHRNAGGGSRKGTLEAAVEALLQEFRRALKP